MVFSLTFTVPALAAEPHAARAGVAVFGSYVNERFAEREAKAVAERLGVALAVTAVEIDGAVFYRIVSEPLPEAAARQLVERASRRGQDAWFAALPAADSGVVAEAVADVLEPEPLDPATAPVVQPAVEDPVDAVTEEPETQIQVAEAAWTSRFHRVELGGSASAESRWFYRDIGHAGQRSLPNGFVATPQLYIEDRNGSSFTLSPFFRFDGDDPQRTHADLHEAYALFFVR